MVHEHMNYYDEHQIQEWRMLNEWIAKLENVINVETEFIFGQDYTHFDRMIEMTFDQSFQLLEEYITVIL